MAVITLRHAAIDKLFKAFKLPTRNLASFRLESKRGDLVTLNVTYLVEGKEMEDVERIFKDFILIEKPI